MQCAILSCVICPAVQYFSTLSNKRHDLKKNIFNLKCVRFSVQLLSETFILRIIERDMVKICIGLQVTCPLLFLSDFNETWNSQTDFRKIPIPNFMKNRSVLAELFYVDGRRTDRHDKANSRFSRFCERTKKSLASYSDSSPGPSSL